MLRRLPDSRLLLKGLPLADASTRRIYEDRLRERGISPDRVTLTGAIREQTMHLAHYGEIDIALDPFPYNGTTTTCEALWMGVPVITLQGDRHCGRVGASLLAAVGLDDLVAWMSRDYVDIAVRLASDPSRLERCAAPYARPWRDRRCAMGRALPGRSRPPTGRCGARGVKETMDKSNFIAQ